MKTSIPTGALQNPALHLALSTVKSPPLPAPSSFPSTALFVQGDPFAGPRRLKPPLVRVRPADGSFVAASSPAFLRIATLLLVASRQDPKVPTDQRHRSAPADLANARERLALRRLRWGPGSKEEVVTFNLLAAVPRGSRRPPRGGRRRAEQPIPPANRLPKPQPWLPVGGCAVLFCVSFFFFFKAPWIMAQDQIKTIHQAGVYRGLRQAVAQRGGG